MKKIFFTLFALTSIAFAFGEKEKDGFGGTLFLFGGLRNIQSNIAVMAKKDSLNSYESKNKRKSMLAALFGSFSYKGLFFDDKISLKGFSGRDLSGLGLGYEIAYAKNFSSELIFVSSVLEKTYANPYLIGDRAKSSVDRFGVKFTQNFSLGERQKVSLSYTFSSKNVINDRVEFQSLKRDAKLHQAEISYTFLLASAAFHYDYNDALGKAESYKRFGGELGAIIPFSKQWISMLKFGLSTYKKEKDNVIFNARQKGNITKFNVNLIKRNLFAQNNLSLMLNYGLEKRNSNIDFYDETFNFIFLGLGYKF